MAMVTIYSFEMLAFKNDVAHWRKKNELVGVSVRTVCDPFREIFIQFRTCRVSPDYCQRVCATYYITLSPGQQCGHFVDDRVRAGYGNGY